jgi:predicted permease
MLHSDRGYDPSRVLTAELSLPKGRDQGPSAWTALAGLLERLRATPGFSRVALATALPLTSGETLGSFPLRASGTGERVQVQTAVRVVSRDYFAVLGIRLVEGRLFDATDTPTSRPVVIVNRAFASKYLGARPVGQQLWDDAPGAPGPEVVGVIESVRHRSATDSPAPEMYRAFEQGTAGGLPLRMAISTTGDSATQARALRALVRDYDSAVLVDAVAPLESLLMASLAQPRLYSVLGVFLAVLTLVIGSVGLFGVLGYTVAQRTREIGVRTAIGARPFDIAWMLIRQGLLTAGVGLGVGLAASLALGRSLAALLYGVTAYDTVSYAGGATFLLAAAAVACAIPARRAARIDPVEALRR